ncbi:hypothetical protein MKX01_004592, partial [Papaver californicum]
FKFLCAAHDGKLKRLKKCAAALEQVLGDGIPTIIENTKNEFGRSAIHLAAAGGRVNVLKYLIEEMKLDIDVKAASAAIEGHLAAVQYLLEMGINVDVTDDFGSPLHYAATAGEHETVKVLLDHGGNPNLVFHDTFIQLQASIHSQSWRCAEQLLKAGADPNGGPDGAKALLLAAEVAGANPYITNIVRVATQIIKLLVEAGADPICYKYSKQITLLHGLRPTEIAAINGNRRGVEILFPVTSPVPSYVDWSANGIRKHENSKKFEQKAAVRSHLGKARCTVKARN